MVRIVALLALAAVTAFSTSPATALTIVESGAPGGVNLTITNDGSVPIFALIVQNNDAGDFYHSIQQSGWDAEKVTVAGWESGIWCSVPYTVSDPCPDASGLGFEWGGSWTPPDTSSLTFGDYFDSSGTPAVVVFWLFDDSDPGAGPIGVGETVHASISTDSMFSPFVAFDVDGAVAAQGETVVPEPPALSLIALGLLLLSRKRN
jgi:hypothetical protein